MWIKIRERQSYFCSFFKAIKEYHSAWTVQSEFTLSIVVCIKQRDPVISTITMETVVFTLHWESHLFVFAVFFFMEMYRSDTESSLCLKSIKTTYSKCCHFLPYSCLGVIEVRFRCQLKAKAQKWNEWQSKWKTLACPISVFQPGDGLNGQYVEFIL